MTIIYYTISDDSGSMTEFCVGIAATARPLKPAAWRPWQRALGVTRHGQAVCVGGAVATMQTWAGTALRQGGQHSAIVYMAPKMTRTWPDGRG